MKRIMMAALLTVALGLSLSVSAQDVKEPQKIEKTAVRDAQKHGDCCAKAAKQGAKAECKECASKADGECCKAKADKKNAKKDLKKAKKSLKNAKSDSKKAGKKAKKVDGTTSSTAQVAK